jgi:hypothetical protein
MVAAIACTISSYGEYVANIAIVVMGPQVVSGVGLEQLRRDADPIAQAGQSQPLFPPGKVFWSARKE